MTSTAKTSTRPVVGINLTWLDPGVVGGSEEYSIRLVRSLADRNRRDLEFRMYCRRSVVERYPDLQDRFPVDIMPNPRPGRMARVALENSWLAHRRRRDQVVHHMGGVVPQVGAGTDIVTVYDLQPLDLPDNFSLVKRRWLGAAIPASVQRAKFVVSPSQFTSERLVKRLNVPTTKIRLIPFGFGPPVDAEVIDVDSADTTEHHKPLQLPNGRTLSVEGLGRFLLYPAITYPHKRHEDLIRALSLLPESCGDIKLVFTGRAGPETLRLRRLAHDLGVANRMVFTGRIAEADLTVLYRSALAMTFPSAYEGFGNPCIEAMVHGCPLVVSKGGSLPEVAGEAAIHVPVGDAPSWADAIARLADSDTLASALVRRGRLQLESFQPDRAVDRLLGVYDEALG